MEQCNSTDCSIKAQFMNTENPLHSACHTETFLRNLSARRKCKYGKLQWWVQAKGPKPPEISFSFDTGFLHDLVYIFSVLSSLQTKLIPRGCCKDTCSKEYEALRSWKYFRKTAGKGEGLQTLTRPCAVLSGGSTQVNSSVGMCHPDILPLLQRKGALKAARLSSRKPAVKSEPLIQSCDPPASFPSAAESTIKAEMSLCRNPKLWIFLSPCLAKIPSFAGGI